MAFSVFRVARARGPVWYAKYRLPDARQVQRKIGPVWTERGRPAAGYFTKRTAEAWLRDLLDVARRGASAGLGEQPIAATFEDAAAEWLRFIEQDRRRKPSPVGGYASTVRTQLLPTFGAMPLQSITADTIDAWLAQTAGSVSSRRKSLVLLHGIVRRARKVWGLRVNPAADAEKPPLARSGDIEVFSPEEVWALERADGSELDAALYLTAAFTGLRMGELLALRWRDIDFAGNTVRVRASFYNGHLTTPKSSKARAVPLAPDVANALAQLGRPKRCRAASNDRWWWLSGRPGGAARGPEVLGCARWTPLRSRLDLASSMIDPTGMRRQVTRAAVIPSPPSGLDDANENVSAETLC